MIKIDRPALVAQIHNLSKVESEFEQLLNLPERQDSSHDASMFDGEKEAIENNEVESEEGSYWGHHHIVPLTAQIPLYQGANKAANANLSMAVNGSRSKSQLCDSHPSEASQHGPRQSDPLSSSSARSVLNTKVLNAQVASTQVSSTQATGTQTADAQDLSAQADSSRGPDMQVLSQKVASIKVFSTTASVATQGNIQLEANIDGITSTETLKRLSSIIPSQPPQPNHAVGSDPVVDAPVLMSKVPVQKAPVSKESMLQVPVPKLPTVASKLVRQAQSEPSTNQPIANEAAKLQSVLTPLKSVTQMQPESSTNRAVESRVDTHVEKTAVLVPSNAQAGENDTQASVVLTQEASPVLMTRMDLFGLGAKLAALGAGHMLTSVQPVLSSPMLHHQIAPEYFTHYAQLNTYRVFFRNKYYLFQFEDHKVTNFLGDYYDRH